MLKSRDLERKIILQLLEDGRQPILQIAKNVGATRQTVAKKLEQLSNSGLISSFAPKLEPEKFGLVIQAYIFMREDPQSDLRKKNEEVIKGFHQVSEFHRVFGKYDSVVKVLVESKKELTDFVKKLHGLSGVRETETFIVHSTIKNKPEDPFKKILTVLWEVTEAFQTSGLSIKVKEMKGPIVEGELPRCREVRNKIVKQTKIQ